MDVTHIMLDPRSGKSGMLNEEDDDDDCCTGFSKI